MKKGATTLEFEPVRWSSVAAAGSASGRFARDPSPEQERGDPIGKNSIQSVGDGMRVSVNEEENMPAESSLPAG